MHGIAVQSLEGIKMFCKYCGTELENQATVCPNCGAHQQESQAAPQAAPQPTPQPTPQPAPQPAAPQYAQQTPPPAPQYAQQTPPPAPIYVAPQQKKVNGIGIAGFVVSLISLGLGVYFCIVPIAALVLSAVAMGLRAKYNSCNGLAIAGLVISIVAVVFWAIIWIVAASMIGAIFGGFMSLL